MSMRSDTSRCVWRICMAVTRGYVLEAGAFADAMTLRCTNDLGVFAGLKRCGLALAVEASCVMGC